MKELSNEEKARNKNHNMKARARKYFAIKSLEKLASTLTGCIEFPHFGANYPDATCIEGYLWDLDSGDSEGLSMGGDDPCPCCRTRSYIENMVDNEISIGRIQRHIKFIFSRYGRIKSTQP